VVVAAIAGHSDDTLPRVKRTLLSLLLGAMLLGPAATAVAQNPIDDYRRNGVIDPCKYTDGQLRQGQGNLPPDVEQYAPGLADQLNQGRGGCGGGAPGGTETRQGEAVPGPGAAGTGGPGGRGGADGAGGAQAEIKAPPTPVVGQRIRLADISTPAVSQRPGGDVPGWVLPLLLLALVIAAIVAVIRLTGADASRFTRPLGVAFRDAGERSGDAMASLWDRVRLGR
jgi:hypothetical protein